MITPPPCLLVAVFVQIRELREEGDCSVTIVTGDSVLTACHVAAEIGLIDGAPTAPAPPGTSPIVSSEPSPAELPSKKRGRTSKRSKSRDGEDASTIKGKGSGGRRARTRAEGGTKGKKSAAGKGDGDKNEPIRTVPVRKGSSLSPKTKKREMSDGASEAAGRKSPLLLTVVPTELGVSCR